MALCSMGTEKGPPRSTSSTSAVLLPVRGTERGLLAVVLAVRSTSCNSQLFRVRDSRLCRTRHRRLPSGIGTKVQSRPLALTGSSVKKVSTTCRLRVDHVYSGTLSGTLILVPFSCHKTGTSSTSMERLQTGSLSNVDTT